MLRKIIVLIIFSLLSLNGLFAQETFKMMFYNLLNFPYQNSPSNRIQYLEIVLSEYQPDVFMVCELNNFEGSEMILSMMQSFNSNYSKAVFANNTSDDLTSNQNDLQNLLYYDQSKFTLESQAIVTTIYRDFNHYRLKLNTIEQNSDPLYIDAIVCHLKSSQGSENQAQRLQMIYDLENYLDTFPSDSNVILAGDFNMYRSSESGFVELTNSSNNIVFADPADRVGNWHNNTDYIDVMTQSTRTQTGYGGASGGFDDRFDFILTSENLLTDTDLHYVDDSYKVIGNNAEVSCYNQEINSEECAGSLYSFAMRDALYHFSDHLPVTIQLQTTQSLSMPEYVYQKPIEFIGSNIIKHTLHLKINNQSASNQTLNVYDNIGKLIKTINTKNSLYIYEDMSMLATGMYYILLPQMNMKPLKFVIAH